MNIEIEVDADGDYYAGSEDRFDKNYGNWLPGDPPQIKNLKVTLNKSNRSVDITDVLPNWVKQEIEEALIEENESEEVA